MKVRLLLASSYLEDLLVVFLLILCVNGVLYVPMKNGCAVRGFFEYDRNLASINNLLKVVILNERGTRAQKKQDAGVIT